MPLKSPNKLELERHSLAALVQNPDIFADIDNVVKENFYSNKLNQIIFSVIRAALLNKEPIDKFTISNKISNLNLTFEIDVYSYLEALELIQINKEASLGYFKDLAKIWGKEQIFKQTEEIQKYLNNSANDSFDQVIAKSDALYGEVINNFNLNNEPQDLFAGLEEYIEGIADDDKKHEIVAPYQKYQNNYGGWYPGDLVVFVSPPKSGKSTILLDILIKTTQSDSNVRALMIDTELETYRVQRRLLSNLTGVHEKLLKDGTWRNNSITLKKVREIWPLIKKYFSKIDHIYVANATTEEQHSIIRRWHWKNINTTGKKAIVALDYFKLTLNDGVDNAYAGSMKMGYAVDATKKLASELQCPILAAAQANAADETGLSKEVNKFASSVFLFKKKTLDDIALEGGKSTHKLVPMFTRDVGLEYDSIDTVKITKDKKDMYIPNHINFRIDSFVVTEMNTLQEQLSLQMLPKKPKSESGDLF
jgi:replicative DNA helicase